MTDDEKRRLMTPSGRPSALGAQPFALGRPNLPNALSETAGVQALVMPKLDSPMVQLDGKLAIPWQQMLVNMCRVAQSTQAIPGTYTSVTVNEYGQVTHGTSGPSLMDAPSDDNVYGRKNGQWVVMKGE